MNAGAAAPDFKTARWPLRTRKPDEEYGEWGQDAWGLGGYDGRQGWWGQKKVAQSMSEGCLWPAVLHVR
eukprot:1154188-Pelagomonas_calceolata.AAC.3